MSLPIQAQPISVAQTTTSTPETITGSLSSSSPTLEDDGSYYETHTFEGNAGETLTIDLTSDDFDAYLILVSPTEEWIAQDDDGGGNRNARITITLPDTGTYRLIVNSYEASEIGKYRLELRTATSTEQGLSQASQVNQSITGELGPDSQVRDDGSYYETHAFEGNAEETLTFELISDEFEGVLYLLNPDMERVAMDLAGGYLGPNAQIILKLPATGAYTLIVNSRGSGPLPGSYQLNIRTASTTEQVLGQVELLREQARDVLFDENQPEEAFKLTEEALFIAEQAFGPNHLLMAATSTYVATLYISMERDEEAEVLYQRAVRIHEQVLGNNHPETASSLADLAEFYYQTQRYEEAESLYHRALTISEQALGSYSDKTAPILIGLAELYLTLNRDSEADRLVQQVIAIYEQTFGTNHDNTLKIFDDLAYLYKKSERYEQAETLYQQAINIREQTYGPNHLATADSLDSLAWFYQQMRRFEEAAALYQRVMAIYETVYGPDHPQTAEQLEQLSFLYHGGYYGMQGRFDEAAVLYERVVAIYETVYGSDSKLTGTSYSTLALIYRRMGRYGEAEPLFRQALEIFEAVYGLEDDATASILNNLATLYQAMGRFDEAETLFLQAITIEEQQINPNGLPSYISNLALLYQDQGRLDEAETLYLQALRISESNPGRDDFDHARIWGNLATLYNKQGRLEDAEGFAQRSLNINEQTLGTEHRSTATSMNNLASVYLSLGRFEEAELLYQRAFAIFEKTLGLEHPSTTIGINNLANLYHSQGNFQLALSYYSQGLAGEEKVLSRNLVGGSDANKRDYLATMVGTTSVLISLHLHDLPTDVEASQLALLTVLQRKGRILDIFTNVRTQLSDDPEALALLDELSAASTQLANLTFNPPDELAQAAYQSQLAALQQQIRDLEDQLSRRSSDFADLTASPSLEDIQAALPTGTALVEFIRYRPFDPTASRQERLGEPRYAAYVLHADGTIQGIDLGPAAAIEPLVTALSTSLATANTPIGQIKHAAQPLETLVMAPVRDALGETTTVFLSPDGALNLIPFEALVDESGDYLVERYQFRYLTSGRDLMRLDGDAENTGERNPALLVGNPTYGLPGELVAQADTHDADTHDADTHETGTRTIDFETRRFLPLSGTQVEVDLIASELAEVEVYTQTNATEAVLKAKDSPSILHIATHGFFEPIEETLNPLLQSGLILAGAGAGGQSGPDQSGRDQNGILTALEVTGMNLSGTQLVVLSACETGLGEITAGEGVYGLRRAFVLAGSQTQVISLWKVDDIATQELMVDYYDRLLSGTPRDAALRETQLAFLNSEEYSHPYYWAAFIGSGDWRPLQQ